MKALEVGERIACYEYNRRYVGVVSGFDCSTIRVCIRDDSTSSITQLVVHSKQCRRLIPKKRREWWVWVESNGKLRATAFESLQAANGCEQILVREVRKK